MAELVDAPHSKCGIERYESSSLSPPIAKSKNTDRERRHILPYFRKGWDSIEQDFLRKTTMAQRLKRWESPRNEGRNDKGRGGSARQRQLKKQRQALRRRLKDQTDGHNNVSKSNKKGENHWFSPFLFDRALNCPALPKASHLTASGSESDAIAFH